MNSPAISSGDHDVSEALGLWEPKRTLTLEAARKHSKRIKVLRVLLIAIAMSLVGYLVYEFSTGGATTTFTPVEPTESVRMIGPRYSGRTDAGEPYYLTAETATRKIANRNEVDLKNPVLEFIRETGVASSFVVAETGTYNDVEKILNLKFAVDMTTDDGNICKTTQARIFAREKRIEGDERIKCKGSFGIANGNAYEIKDNYKTFVFKNGMDAIIEREAADPQTSKNRNGQAFGDDTPIDITADTATYMGGLTVLTGNVDVKQGNNRTNSNEMDIFREEAKGESEGSLKLGAIRRIDAKGDFKYTTPENLVTGDRGVYERGKEIMTVTGDVKVKQPSGSTAETNKLIYNVKTETIRFTGDCQGQGCSPGRQSVTIRN